MHDTGSPTALYDTLTEMTNKLNTPNNSPYRTRHKLLLSLITHQAMKAKGQGEAECHSFLTSEHGNEWLALCQGHFTLKTRSPGTE
jgi:hypothetical protein